MWHFQRGTNLHNVLGPGYNLLNTVCHWTAPSGRGEGKQSTDTTVNQTAAEPEGRESSNCPCPEEKIQGQVSSHSEGWGRGWPLTTNGRDEARGNHPILVSVRAAEEFTHQTGGSILSWLLQIWDAVAKDMNLGGEARQFRSLFWRVVIDQGVGESQEHLSLWRWLRLNVKERYLCKEAQQGQWNTVEWGIHCLRETARLGVIFSDGKQAAQSPCPVQITDEAKIHTAWVRDILPLLSNTSVDGERRPRVLWLANSSYMKTLLHLLTGPHLVCRNKNDQACPELVRKMWEGHQKLWEELIFRLISIDQSLLLGTGTPWLGREDTLHKITCGFTCLNMENTWGGGMENPPLTWQHGYVS